MSRQPRRDEYTVGWVCALPIESAAARVLLDERYDAPAREAGERMDDDIYFTGSMAGHNVVIACLPGRTGTSTAAALAARMLAKFRGIRFGLMVGIGGGVPSNQNDIRLGDVVVSVPDHTFGGVVQYDKGKTTPTEVIRTGSLDSPPQILLSAVSALESDTIVGESRLLEILSKIEQKPRFRRRESSADVLYDAKNKQVVRPRRGDGEKVKVHHGTIASGEQVMKSAMERDAISERLGGVLCFEMEAAGLMNNFRCLVIRGISDYADSQKNDEWHGYAAATAAAYAKEILSKIPREQVLETTRAGEAMGNKREHDAQSADAHEAATKRRRILNSSGSETRLEENNQHTLQDRTRQRLTKEQKEHLRESLKFEQINERKNTIRKAHAKTCKWLLTSTAYTSWLDSAKIHEHHGFLWIKGKAGSGKSTLMKFVLEQAPKKTKVNAVLSFFFNARGSTIEKSTTGAYRSLLFQLLIAFPELRDVFESFYWPTSSFDAAPEWSVDSLKTLLEKAIQQLKNVSVMCFVDALDECDETQIEDMVRFFAEIGELSVKRGLRFLACFASRHYPRIILEKSLEIVLEQQQGHGQDITSYIETELKIGTTKIAQEVRAEVCEKATGIFMWVVLVVGILNKTYVRGRLKELRKKLREIPSDLYDLFQSILTRDSNNKEEVVLCIQWVLFARQPLSPEQLYHAILSGSDLSAISDCESEEISEEMISNFLLDCSKGLTDITISKNRKVQFIHESVRDFLLKGDGLSKAWPEYKDNFQGQSHERLKQCSKRYLAIDLNKRLELPDSMPQASSQKAKNLRLTAAQQYPLLEYAVTNIFYHSELAESHGISQAGFLHDFDLELWVVLDNMFQKFETRRHQTSVSLLYILAELDCANLIRNHFPRDQFSRIETERYGCPLFAAVAHANNAATRALAPAIRLTSSAQNTRGSHLDTAIEKSNLDFNYAKTRSFVSNAASLFPEWLMTLLLESLEYAADIKPSNMVAALIQASLKGNEAVVVMLLRDQAALLDSQPDSREHALCAAVEKGHESIVKLLVSKGAKAGVKDRHGKNAVHIASEQGSQQIVGFLLDNRPDLLDSTTTDGATPLLLAIEHSYQDIAVMLLERGANVHFQHSNGSNALIEASSKALTSLTMLLLDKGADVNAQGGKYGNALQAACARGSKDIVELLLDKGVDVNAQGGHHNNALNTVRLWGRKEIEQLITDSTRSESNSLASCRILKYMLISYFHQTLFYHSIETLHIKPCKTVFLPLLHLDKRPPLSLCSNLPCCRKLCLDGKYLKYDDQFAVYTNGATRLHQPPLPGRLHRLDISLRCLIFML